MKFNKDERNKPWVQYAIAGCVTITFYVLLSNIGIIASVLGKIGDFIQPVIAAACIAYVLHPLEEVFEKYVFKNVRSESIRRNLSVTGAFIGILVFFIILMVALIPQIGNSVMTLARNLSTYTDSLSDLLERIGNTAADHNIDIDGIINSGDSLLSTFSGIVPENLPNIIGTSFSIGSSIGMTVISSILAIYFLAAKDMIIGGLKRLVKAIMPVRYHRPFSDFMKRCNHILIRYIIYDLLDGLIVGMANWFFFVFTGMPYGVLLAVVCGITNLAPTFGPIVGGAIGCFVLLLVNPWYSLWFLIFTIVLQIIDGYIIKPKLFGDTFGVSSVWILVCLILGGRIFGVAGILLAIPFAAISDHLYKTVIIVRLEKRQRR